MAKYLKPGARIARYRILEPLDSGAEGTAYLAASTTGERIVLKQHRYSVKDSDHTTGAERVRRLQFLVGKRHPCVCEILEIFEHDGLLYEAMEYVEGDSLEVVMAEYERVPLNLIASVVHDILAGLDWLHTLGVVHRDVKPANVIVWKDTDECYHAKLIDLGIALHCEMPRLTRRTFGVGTYEYAPREIIFTDFDVDGRADLHSVGAILFEALTGRLPFVESAGEDLFKRILKPLRPSIREIVPEISAKLDEYVQRLMALEPKDRPSSARQAWAELEAILDAETGYDTATMVPPEPVYCTDDSLGVSAACDMELPCLQVTSGSLKGTSIPVPRGGVTLGRSLINPGDPLISRFHVRAKAKKEGIFLRDLRSHNGLIYKERRLRKAFLRPGDEVRVGATVLRLS